MLILLCQCPERGDLHFYQYVDVLVRVKNMCVNALKGATSISTLKPPVTEMNITCVNALKGATSISTLASGNPHK